MSGRATTCASVTCDPHGISMNLTTSSAAGAEPSSEIEQIRQKLLLCLQCQPELRELLELCGESNAWTAEEAIQRPDTITTIELFLLQVPRVPLVPFFPNLVTVKLMSIGLESIANFASLAHVEELWLSDNNIRVIEGLDNMTRLRRLYLQGNRIDSLNGMPPLRHLRELWLSRNRLSALTHLTPLRKLRSLYVSCNPLESLENAFSKDMSHLHEVNLSGCHLSSITELRHLQQLSCLRNLWLLDPLFGDNPICRLNNYVTLTISMLSSLDTLDGTFVTPEQRSLVESVLHKKQLYYAMRAQMLDTQITLLARHAEACALRHTRDTGRALLRLKACVQPIEHELAERAIYHLDDKHGAGGSSGSLCGVMAGENKGGDHAGGAPLVVPTATLEALGRQLSRAIDTREVQERKTMLKLAEATQAAKLQAQLLTERFAVELHTAGNVRLESLSPDHEAYVAAVELVRERFDSALFDERFGIAGVEVTCVRRILNRGLRLRFDDRVKELHVDLANPQLRSRFVGLFGIVPVTQRGQSACLQHVLVCGMAARLAAPSEDGKKSGVASQAGSTWYQPVPAEEGVPLTNSLFYADEERLLSCCATTGGASRGCDSSPPVSQQSYNTGALSSGSEASPLCRGQVVLYRVYLGKTVHALGGGGCVGRSTSSPASFLKQNGRVWRKDYGADTCAAYRLLPSTAATTPAGESGSANAQPLPSPYMWYCFDRALLLPDCVVDYTYSMHNTPLTQPARSPTTAGGGASWMSRAEAMALLTGFPLPPMVECEASSAGADDSQQSSKGTDAVEDVLHCGEPLLQFICWCSPPSKHARSRDTVSHGNTLQQVAETETNEALARAHKVLGKACMARLLRNGAVDDSAGGGDDWSNDASSSSAANPLHARHVDEYAAQMCVNGAPLSLCVLRSRGITAVLQDFATPLCASITALDLAHNRIASVSWFALAKEAPQLQRLNLSGNALSRLHFDGSALPALRVLDVSNNELVSVTDFAAIRTAAGALEELVVYGNPFLQHADGQEAEARLWLYLLPPPTSATATAAGGSPAIVKLNAHALGTYPGTLASQRFRRACLLPGGRVTPQMSRVTACLVKSVQRDEELGCAAAGLFSVEGATTQESCFEQVAAQLEMLMVADKLEVHLREACQRPPAADEARPRFLSEALGGSDLPLSPSLLSCLNECHTFRWSHGLLDDPRGLVGLLPNLCHLTLRGQALRDIHPLLHLRRLESLNLSENHLTELPCLEELRALRELVLDFNELTALPQTVGPLPALRMLSASGNKIAQVDVSLFVRSTNGTAALDPPSPSAATPTLEALYLMYNRIADMNIIYALRDVSSLLILNVAGNPCTAPRGAADDDEVRPYLIHAFPRLKVLDGVSISAAEMAKAREVYAGKINSDLLIERARGPPETWASVRNLNLSHCSLKEVNLLEPFKSLEVLHLQHNLLVSVLGVAMLTELTALDLSHNRLGSPPWRNPIGGALNANGTGAPAAAGAIGAATTSPAALGDTLARLRRLQSLSLEANQLTDLSTLKLCFPHLKFLNIRCNELQFIQRGLENMPELRELLLDQNKLRGLGSDSFAANKKLIILSAENNALRSVEGLQRCRALEQLRLGANRLGDLSSLLNELQSCPLKAVVLVGNPIARKTNYRAAVINRLTQLTDLDRRVVTQEERDKAASARMMELVAPPNVVIDMNYFAGMGAAPAGSPAPPQQNGLNVNGFAGATLNGGTAFSSRGRGVAAPVNGAAVKLSPSQPQLTGIRAAIVPNKRGGDADRLAANQRTRPYRR
ncbi:Leucine rich repeat/Leucine Rich repeats (2 copies)/Leucine Rich Repeat, putative [Leishmania donovani]|uniref:Leucine-rich repeat and coiled-coil domain-containing protein 1 n=1 Tax=Leishmania donovani TaxID=5661 RepID=A0A3S7WY40_LEIDO|nr:Leucine rich repeat/Leucine Rich repeats (2 copies)/Leucine Rich Repeat, putative [Leishmania donovani]